MTTTPDRQEAHQPGESELRANTYSLLAALLRSAPDATLLSRLRGIDSTLGPSVAASGSAGGDPVAAAASDAIAAAWEALARATETAESAALDDEFHDLFIGVGRGELVPYGSYYLTGFLMEKPLGVLRQELSVLGFERQAGNREPEDHAAALCEVMALLALDDAIPHNVESRFFETHVGSWMEKLFLDLQQAKAAVFYRAVGQLGAAFISLEQRYLAMGV